MPKKDNARIVFLSGDASLAQGAYEAGVMVAASYPGTPATEILEYLAGFSEVASQWSVNEKVAYEVTLAAAIAGLRSLYASKHVGLNVAMDPLMTSAYTGVNAGLVVVSCDDPQIHSSQNEQDNRLIARMAKIPLLEPVSPCEAKEFVKVAFGISERFDTPVLLRLTTRIAHTKENVQLGERKSVAQKKFQLDPEKYVMVPRNAYRRHIALEKRLVRLKRYSQATPLNRMEIQNKKRGFITSGVAYLYAKENFPDASFLKIGMGFPFPEKLAQEFSRRVKEIVVLEELEPFLEEQLKMLGIKFKSKDPSFRIGELRPEYIPQILQGRVKKEAESTARRPLLCAGCPHRPVFWVLKKLKTIVTGDIGCYTLGAMPPLSSLHSCLCMGSGITFFEGFRKALGKNVVGVIGDSTFVHSGIAGLINLSYNRTSGLVIILDNGTTAMTGNQPHPASGLTIKGEPTKKLILENLCLACGADNLDVIDPHHLEELEALIKKRLAEEALSVVITRSPCRLISRQKNAVPLYQKEKCKQCHLCLEIDCPALHQLSDGFIQINPSLCVGCDLCVKICRLGAILKNA